jgi:hypothetical protein
MPRPRVVHHHDGGLLTTSQSISACHAGHQEQAAQGIVEAKLAGLHACVCWRGGSN